MSVWVEVWTRPGDPNFGRVIDDPGFADFGLYDAFNLIGEGNASIPRDSPHIDSILKMDKTTPANSVRSLVRYWDDDDLSAPLFEWLPSVVVPAEDKDSPNADITGSAIEAVMAEARLEAYDWDGSDDFTPRQPDWQWGGEAQNLLRNPDAENEGFPNGGGEDGNANYWKSTPDDILFNPATINAINSTVDARSGDWYILLNPNGQMSGALRTVSGLIAGETYTITGYLKEPTASGDRYRAGVEGAVSASHANAYESDGIWWAELDNVVAPGGSDGTYQQFTLTFVAEGNQVALFVVYDDINDFNAQLDDWSISGDNVGMDPWTAFALSRERGSVINVAEVSNLFSRSGTSSIRFQGVDAPKYSVFGRIGYGTIGFKQDVTSLVPGRTYTAEFWARHDGASDQYLRLVLNRITPKGDLASTITGTKAPGPGSYHMAAETVLVPPNTWTRVRLTTVADVTGVQFSVRYAGTLARSDVGTFTSPNIYVDDMALYEGLPATTVGDILNLLYNHATDPNLRSPICWDDGSGTDTPYLTLDFDEVNDSGGNAWAESEETIKLWMRMRYDQILGEFAGRGYEWRVVPNDVEAGTWKLQVYNPGGMQTDHTTVARPAIQGGSDETRRAISRFLPSGTDWMVEGLGRVTARARNAGLMSTLGRIEGTRLDRQLPSLAAARLAVTEEAANALTSSEAFGYTLVAPTDTPLTHYEIGDLLTIHDPPDFDGAARLVDVVGYFSADREEWETQFMESS